MQGAQYHTPWPDVTRKIYSLLLENKQRKVGKQETPFANHGLKIAGRLFGFWAVSLLINITLDKSRLTLNLITLDIAKPKTFEMC